jgi:membrane protease YdiL (CAAX protease family)
MNRAPTGDDADNRPPGFWRVVGLLLATALRRRAGRRARQRQLLGQQTGKPAGGEKAFGVPINVTFFAYVGAVVMMSGVHIVAAVAVIEAVAVGARDQRHAEGRVVVTRGFYDEVVQAERAGTTVPDPSIADEAHVIARDQGVDEARMDAWLRADITAHGARDLVHTRAQLDSLAELPRTGRLARLLGALVVAWWAVMLVAQGEGLELDLQRRRHPLWEWLFSHPVPAGAVFLAEMAGPLVANPAYWTAPWFVGVLFAQVYGPGAGVLAAVLVGIPVTAAAACAGKAIETWTVLRVRPRNRGAVVGIMSWLGYAAMMGFIFLFGAMAMDTVFHAVGRFVVPLVALPWPWLTLLLGGAPDGSWSFARAVALDLALVAAVIAAAVAISARAVAHGLVAIGDTAPEPLRAPVPAAMATRFGREPLYRKELLWFIRDRSAVVQTILIPMTLAGVQLFNFRFLLQSAQGQWHLLCGVAVVFGTYFLWILGPKSLASEGAALWLALTWPRGLESLLKAKAWLWSMIATAVITPMLIFAAVKYPEAWWKIALVGIGWHLFGRSMAAKAVTLVTVASSSGEAEPTSRANRWAASLGMLTFAIGVFGRQWQLAVIGIVYSHITAAAMWQNLRARLPYLFDPWSERPPPPPTLMHAMIAISLLVEATAVLSGMILAAVGGEHLAALQVAIYAACALAVAGFTARFLARQGVPNRRIWCWHDEGAEPPATAWWCGDGSRGGAFARALAAGAGGGLALAGVAIVYQRLLTLLPWFADAHPAGEPFPGYRWAYAVIAVFGAPFAEEYLFRGLLFRALDREWGGWRALLGSAAFFAIYHPPTSWLPVGLVGLANAYLFKRTGRLVPCVALHMVYNAVVVTPWLG